MCKLIGGCACGNIRYKIQGEPEFSFHCQCSQCQKITGAGHSSQFMVSVNTAEITGEIKYYQQPTDGNNMKDSGFCPNCGSPILTKSSGYPESLYFHAVTLDNANQFQPTKLVCSSTGQQWDYIDPKIKVL